MQLLRRCKRAQREEYFIEKTEADSCGFLFFINVVLTIGNRNVLAYFVVYTAVLSSLVEEEVLMSFTPEILSPISLA